MIERGTFLVTIGKCSFFVWNVCEIGEKNLLTILTSTRSCGTLIISVIIPKGHNIIHVLI